MDLIDRAQMAQERDTRIALLERENQKRHHVSTGFCTECGLEIPPARLKAINAATCIECARILEREDKKWR